MTGRAIIAVQLSTVDKRFGPRAVLDRVSLKLAPGEVVALTGPSGAGKTTLLRLIAGLDTPDAGEICLGGRLATDGAKLLLAPHQRGVGMVFQQPALWPHMRVREHVSFGLIGIGRVEAEARVQQVLELTEIAHLAEARPAGLSGGEAARVALARALAPAPKVLLLDEPLAHLHDRLRKALAATIRAATQATGAATLIVTHTPRDLAELAHRALALADGQLSETAHRARTGRAQGWKNSVSGRP